MFQKTGFFLIIYYTVTQLCNFIIFSVGSPEIFKFFTQRELYEIMKDYKGKKIDEKFSLLEEQLITVMKYPGDQKSTIRRVLKFHRSDLKKRWIAASYKHERFIKNNEEWLKSSIKLPYWSINVQQKPGRPSKSFNDLSDCSKRRKTKELSE